MESFFNFSTDLVIWSATLAADRLRADGGVFACLLTDLEFEIPTH